MKALLLAGYEDSHKVALRDCDGRPFIDLQIAALRRLGYEVAVVLAGDESDNILRACRALWNCELVFDTNGADACLWTNLKAGLCTTHDWVVALPIKAKTPELSELNQIINEVYTNPQAHQVRSHSFPGPFAITLKGRQLIKKNKDIYDLNDQRWAISQLNASPDLDIDQTLEKIQISQKRAGFPLA